MAAEKKSRLDQALLLRGLARDLKEAQARIMAGAVYVRGRKADEADQRIVASDDVVLRAKRPYVSRGALSWKRPSSDFAIVVPGLKILDLGISTGGFSDFLLQCGAAAVIGVDVNTSQVDYGLRRDPRLQLLKKNARFLQKEDIPFEPDLIIMDLSFISITMILPVLAVFPAPILALVKPQFEAAKGRVGKGGVDPRPAERPDIVLRLKKRIENLDFAVSGLYPCRAERKERQPGIFFPAANTGKKIHW